VPRKWLSLDCWPKANDIVPIPGTKHVSWLEENVGAGAVELTPEQIERLNAIISPAGALYADMTPVNR
jgi:aryl-alcohol dehydrogenase-like predicted oxidoreductase